MPPRQLPATDGAFPVTTAVKIGSLEYQTPRARFSLPVRTPTSYLAYLAGWDLLDRRIAESRTGFAQVPVKKARRKLLPNDCCHS
jgi:hypothetical protein